MTGPGAVSNAFPTAAGKLLRKVLKKALPAAMHERLRAYRDVFPPVGWVRFGAFRRLRPISDVFGFDRGTPIDRYYIADFLARCGGATGDIRGRVLEIGSDAYTRQFGAPSGALGNHKGVERIDILHVDNTNESATIVGDLATADHIPSATFDCIVCTQTLPFIYDVRAAIRTLERILKPGGVVLVTMPGISQICRPEFDLWGDYWRFTSLSARRLFEERFPAANVEVEAYGNVLAGISFLHGLAARELRAEELRFRDPNYEVLIAVRAVKGQST